jgi:formate hydrogenlyase subunit 3/multisubunit Na+/H+ antiporter MnhD subunit
LAPFNLSLLINTLEQPMESVDAFFNLYGFRIYLLVSLSFWLFYEMANIAETSKNPSDTNAGAFVVIVAWPVVLGIVISVFAGAIPGWIINQIRKVIIH